ncbi:hypothetical protein CYMTET_51579 [Cymbomonas tetramitiformis]|uniref:Uncharacterized protein n=1 Tax=Cymbomonas tetramitiformis TaxID=36881 RepID=A0AAE0BKR7_9CHLO|nr:hypothetical protein CYMTET_51579 [Cymbomonas tetramitiformis]
MDSLATVQESLDEHATRTNAEKQELESLPLHAEMLLGYSRYQDFGEEVATEVLKNTRNTKLLEYIRGDEKLMETIFEEILLKMDGHLNVERCHVIKVLLGLSDHKYNMLKKLLSKTFDEDTGKWRPTALLKCGNTDINTSTLKSLGDRCETKKGGDS